MEITWGELPPNQLPCTIKLTGKEVIQLRKELRKLILLSDPYPVLAQLQNQVVGHD